MFENFFEKYGIGFSFYSISRRDSEGYSHATKWFRFFYLPIFPIKRYRVKFYYSKWAFNYVDVKVDAEVKGKIYLNLILYLKVYIIGTAFYFGAFIIMFYLDSIGVFKGPYVLLMFAYWIILSIVLYRRRNKRVNPKSNQRKSISDIDLKIHNRETSKNDSESYLPEANNCPYCSIAIQSEKGDNKCPNCNIVYVVTKKNRISDFTPPRIDTFRIITFILAIFSHIIFFIVVWEIDFKIVIENNKFFYLLLPWTIHYIIILYIAIKYGFINSPGSIKINQPEGDMTKIRYDGKKKHFLIHLGLYTIGIITIVVVNALIFSGYNL